MTFANSILIIIKQSNGIDYNDLFAKIMPNYKNAASANAALSRALKDMVSFGLVKREANKLLVTDKGLSSISIEMKEKLVLKLNEDMKRPMQNMDDIVRLLVVLTQRSAQDADLLKNAKENASFTISDIDLVRKKIREERKSLKRMSELLDSQAKKLRELDFNDSVELAFDETLATKLALYAKDHFSSQGAQNKIVAEIRNEEVLSKIPTHWKKNSGVSIEVESLDLLLQLLLASPFVKATLYLPGLKLILNSGKATCFSSAKTLVLFVGSQIVESKNKGIVVEYNGHSILPARAHERIDKT